MSSKSSSQSQNFGNDPEKPPIRTKRRYGASCELCRRRKRKCPGKDSTGKSLCTHCSEVGVKCVFPPNGKNSRVPKPVPASAETNNAEATYLRKYIRRLAHAGSDEREQLLNQWIKDERANPLELSLANGMGSRNASQDFDMGSDDEGFDSPSRMDEYDSDRSRPLKKMRTRNGGRGTRSSSADESVDQDESQWRPESALRLSLKPATPADSDSSSVAEEEQNRAGLDLNVSRWVEFFITSAFRGSPEEGPSPEHKQTLLNNYFCWQGPRNSIVDQKVFENAMRDIDTLRENDQKYFNLFLLYSIFSHSIRFVPHLVTKAHEYTAKTHLFMSDALSRPSSIPTVQGMLLLAANHAARGMYAQAWCMTASAIGMILDLECHLDKHRDSEKQGDRGYTHRQMRLRVFWAAYNWDKMLSLALNRTPLLSLDPDQYPPLPDGRDEEDQWKPVYGHDSPAPLFSYGSQPCHEAKCFRASCEANQFLDEIHRNLYRKKLRPHQIPDFVSDMRNRLLQWQKNASRDVIRDFDKQAPPPPPHILQLNLLVQLLWILLYRPFYHASSTAKDSNKAVPHAISTCERAAVKIGNIFVLYDSHYPLGRASYLVIYAAFLSATIDLALANRQKSGSQSILGRLALASRVLEGGSFNIPGMQSSVQTLQRHLHETMSRFNLNPGMLEGSPTITSSSSPSSISTPGGPGKFESPTPPLPFKHTKQNSQSDSPNTSNNPATFVQHQPLQKMAIYATGQPSSSTEVSNGHQYSPPRGNQPTPIDTYPNQQMSAQQEHSHTAYHYNVPTSSSVAPQISFMSSAAPYRQVVPRTVQGDQPHQQPHLQQYPSGGDQYPQPTRRDSIMSDNYSPVSPQRHTVEGMELQMPYYEECNTWFYDETAYTYHNQSSWPAQ